MKQYSGLIIAILMALLSIKVMSVTPELIIYSPKKTEMMITKNRVLVLGQVSHPGTLLINDEPMTYTKDGTFQYEVFFNTNQTFTTTINYIPEDFPEHSQIKTLMFTRKMNRETQETYSPIYRFRPGDIMDLVIENHPESSVYGLMVAPDGRIYTPFVTGLLAADQTVNELILEYQDRFSDYFVDPQISVLPVRQNGNRFTILGEVNLPGIYSLDKHYRLTEVIHEAGGFSTGTNLGNEVLLANFSESYIIRDGKRLDVSFTRLFEKKEFSNDIQILPGDYIYIGSNLDELQAIYMIGDLKSPLTIPFQSGMTLVGTLSYTLEMSPKEVRKVAILRGQGDSAEVLKLNVLSIMKGKEPDILLAPGDIIYIPGNMVRFANELKNSILEIYQTTFVKGLFPTDQVKK